MDTPESSAHPAHNHDDTVETHYASLEREPSPHACLEGWVFIAYEDEHGEEREASYPCRKCANVRANSQ